MAFALMTIQYIYKLVCNYVINVWCSKRGFNYLILHISNSNASEQKYTQIKTQKFPLFWILIVKVYKNHVI